MNTDLPEPEKSIEPWLPPELERVIFEMAASTDKRETMLTLMQVARRVRIWFEPRLYETVVLRSSIYSGSPKFPSADTQCYYPSGEQTSHVRHVLCFGRFWSRTDPDWRELLPNCHNLQSIAFWHHHFEPEALPILTSIVHSPLRTVSPSGLLRLSAPLLDLFSRGQVDFNHVVLKDITHLEILDHPNDLGEWVEGNNLACLKNLQSLAFGNLLGGPFPLEFLSKCLEECEALDLMMLPCIHESITENAARLPQTRKVFNSDGTTTVVPEDRVVIDVVVFASRGWAEDWYRGAEGGDNLWTRGERVVRQRRRKDEIEEKLPNRISKGCKCSGC